MQVVQVPDNSIPTVKVGGLLVYRYPGSACCPYLPSYVPFTSAQYRSSVDSLSQTFSCKAFRIECINTFDTRYEYEQPCNLPVDP